MSSANIRNRRRRSVAGTTSMHYVAVIRTNQAAFFIRRIVGGNDLWMTEYVIKYTTRVVQTVSTMDFRMARSSMKFSTIANPSKRPHGVPNGGKEEMARGRYDERETK